MEHGGLALANGVAVGLEALIGLTILSMRWRGVNARRILSDSAKAALAAAIMGGAILAMKAAFEPSRLILLLSGGITGMIVYLALARILGIEEIFTLPGTALRSLLAREPKQSQDQ